MIDAKQHIRFSVISGELSRHQLISERIVIGTSRTLRSLRCTLLNTFLHHRRRRWYSLCTRIRCAGSAVENAGLSVQVLRALRVFGAIFDISQHRLCFTFSTSTRLCHNFSIRMFSVKSAIRRYLDDLRHINRSARIALIAVSRRCFARWITGLV